MSTTTKIYNKIWDWRWIGDIKIEKSVSEPSHRSIVLPWVLPIGGTQILSGGFLHYLGPKDDYCGSRGVTAPKSGILGGLQLSKLRKASQNPHIEAYCYLRYQPQKVYRAWAEVSFTAWVARATIMAPGGWNFFLASTKTLRNSKSYKCPTKLNHHGYYP